jgi:hypothetical protein
MILSFGVLLWVLFTQKAPYDFLKFSWDVPEFVLSGKREKIPPECPTVYSELIERYDKLVILVIINNLF